MVGTMQSGSIPAGATVTRSIRCGRNTNRREPVMGFDTETLLDVLHGDEDRTFDDLWAEAVHRVEYAAEPHHFHGLDDPSYLIRRDGVLRGMRVA